MIYGDDPQKINEREDALGLKTYSYAPEISAVIQSGNLYVYGISDPRIFIANNIGRAEDNISLEPTVVTGQQKMYDLILTKEWMR